MLPEMFPGAYENAVLEHEKHPAPYPLMRASGRINERNHAVEGTVATCKYAICRAELGLMFYKFEKNAIQSWPPLLVRYARKWDLIVRAVQLVIEKNILIPASVLRIAKKKGGECDVRVFQSGK